MPVEKFYFTGQLMIFKVTYKTCIPNVVKLLNNEDASCWILKSYKKYRESTGHFLSPLILFFFFWSFTDVCFISLEIFCWQWQTAWLRQKQTWTLKKEYHHLGSSNNQLPASPSSTPASVKVTGRQETLKAWLATQCTCHDDTLARLGDRVGGRGWGQEPASRPRPCPPL